MKKILLLYALLSFSLTAVSMQIPASDTVSFAPTELPIAMGYYWSSSLYEQNPSRAYFIGITNGGNIDMNIRTRCTGLTVRPVCP